MKRRAALLAITALVLVGGGTLLTGFSGSSTMFPHRLRCAALHPPLRRSERGLWYFHQGLLTPISHQFS